MINILLEKKIIKLREIGERDGDCESRNVRESGIEKKCGGMTMK
jgi:hypothetical protein